MSTRQRQRGLLTMLVTAKQAARAVNAAYGRGRTYRRGGLIYRDRPSDWFEPIGTIKMAGEQPATEPSEAESPTPIQENSQVSIATAVSGAVNTVKRAIGLDAYDHQQVAKFRQCQTLIAQKAEVAEKQREAGRRLQDAIDARKQGLAEFDGLRIEFAVRELEHAYYSVSALAGRIASASAAAIGFCPDATLQRERRQLRETQKQISNSLVSVGNRIDSETKEVHRLTEQVKSLEESASTHRELAGELAAAKRRLRDAETYLAELNEERTGLDSDRQKFEADREALFARMRAVEV